jgi:hypothetical protein
VTITNTTSLHVELKEIIQDTNSAAPYLLLEKASLQRPIAVSTANRKHTASA